MAKKVEDIFLLKYNIVKNKNVNMATVPQERI